MGAGIDPQAPEAHGLLRHSTSIAPWSAPARLTADSRYALFVNGQEVTRGPIRSQRADRHPLWLVARLGAGRPPRGAGRSNGRFA